MSGQPPETPPVYPGQPLSDEQRRLIALFDELRKNQLTFLDEAGKRVIELSTGLLGLLLAVIAFGGDFPPPYLRGSALAQALVVLALSALSMALLLGVYAVQPRAYPDYESNLSEMRKQFKAMLAHKSYWVKLATWAFAAGALLLALLVAVLVAGG